jgi:regulator of protease activity HflC (stomatin/prohibitin superfamily)
MKILTFYMLCFMLALFNIRTVESIFMFVPTGFVGVQYIWQRLDTKTGLLGPGIHFYNPISTTIQLVETRPQTDIVTGISCGTSDGVPIKIEKVEIGNQLAVDSVLDTIAKYGQDYDKYLVHNFVLHKITERCSQTSAHKFVIEEFNLIDDNLRDDIQKENDVLQTGVSVRFVRLTKPKFPPEMDKHYMDLANEKTYKKVLEQKKETERIKKEAEMLVAQKDAEIKLQGVENTNKVMMSQIKAKQDEQRINNEIIIESAKANAQKIILEAEALQSMYKIPGYTDVEQAKAISQNQKIYYGDKLPASTYPLLKLND